MAERMFSSFPKEGLQFLRSLKRNNNRDWFNRHKRDYEACVKHPIDELIGALALDFAKFAPEMVATPKASAFRIYRDTRFSKDKSPYKTHAAAVFPRAGLGKHQGARFYLHIDPTELFIGGGMYMPTPEDLSAVRSHIAENHQAFRRIVTGRQFTKMFDALNGERLSRVPRGFSADHPAAEYLKYRQFLAWRTFSADVAVEAGFYKLVVETFRGLLPLIRFLNEPIVTSRHVRERRDAMLT
jgi:uncharacterized protein (TIGR02453 family)